MPFIFLQQTHILPFARNSPPLTNLDNTCVSSCSVSVVNGQTGQGSSILPSLPVWDHPSLCWPTLRFLSSVQCVLLASVALFPGTADSSHAETWALLPSPSIHHELAAGASIWKRPIWGGGEICQTAQYFTAESGTKSVCPAVMNRASPSSAGRSVVWYKSLHSKTL